MNAIFGNLTTEGAEGKEDRLGGFRVYESGPYLVKLKMVYTGKSSGGARFITVIADTESGEYKEVVYVTNKKGDNYYMKDDKKNLLPGFTLIDDLCLVTCNKSLSEMGTEDKVVNVYDPEAKKEVPTSVPVLTELLGKEAIFGILKMTKNKQVKNTSTGEFEDTGDSRDENGIDKIFHHPSNLTVVEAQKGIQTPTFYGAWVEKNKGKTQDRRAIKDGAAGGQNGRNGRPGVPPKAADSAQKTTSLFG